MALVRSFLKKVNSLPIKFTVKHYYPFGGSASFLKDQKLDSRESWDYLRENHPSFSIPQDRSEWIKAGEGELHKDGQDMGLKNRAKDVSKILKEKNINSIFSVGSGGAGLEYQIKKMNPEIKITCSENSEQSISLLKNVFIECDNFSVFDMTSQNWPDSLRNSNSLCLIYRVDASFTDTEWRNIFENMSKSGVENILYIPTNFLTIFSLFKRLGRRLGWAVSGQRFIFAGYLRTRRTFEAFWDGMYDEEYHLFGGLGGFILKKKSHEFK